MSTVTKIQWRSDVESALKEAGQAKTMVLLEVFSPKCWGCQNMEERTWTDERVQSVLETQFVPVQINILENAEFAKPPYLAYWTPTLLALCPDNNIHRKWTGFLPPEKLLGELALARVNYALARQAYDEAHIAAQEAVEATEGDEVRHSEALYWQAVAAYKASDDQDLLVAGWKDLLNRYPNSDWAQKVDFVASV